MRKCHKSQHLNQNRNVGEVTSNQLNCIYNWLNLLLWLHYSGREINWVWTRSFPKFGTSGTDYARDSDQSNQIDQRLNQFNHIFCCCSLLFRYCSPKNRQIFEPFLSNQRPLSLKCTENENDPLKLYEAGLKSIIRRIQLIQIVWRELMNQIHT